MLCEHGHGVACGACAAALEAAVGAKRALAAMRRAAFWLEELERHDTLSMDAAGDRARLASYLAIAVVRARAREMGR